MASAALPDASPRPTFGGAQPPNVPACLEFCSADAFTLLPRRPPTRLGRARSAARRGCDASADRPAIGRCAIPAPEPPICPLSICRAKARAAALLDTLEVGETWDAHDPEWAFVALAVPASTAASRALVVSVRSRREL